MFYLNIFIYYQTLSEIPNRFPILSEIPNNILTCFVLYINKPQTQEMNRNFTLKSKIISILTSTTFFSLDFARPFSFLYKHQFIEPALVVEKKSIQSRFINSRHGSRS
jgi:hypothetical protein